MALACDVHQIHTQEVDQHPAGPVRMVSHHQRDLLSVEVEVEAEAEAEVEAEVEQLHAHKVNI